MTTKFKNVALFLVASAALLHACRKREGISVADTFVVFETSAQGLAETENSLAVKLNLSQGTTKDIPVTINLTPVNAVYGVDFTTTPEAVNGSLTVTVPPGNNVASFTVNKVPGALYEGDEKVLFEIYSSAAPVLIGQDRKFTLSFSELVATNSSYMIDGGGATYPNSVFIDLSSNRQTAVQRTSWDLGFYMAAGTDSFYAILNSSTAMMAKQLNKNDLNAVTAADTAGFYEQVAYSPFAPQPFQLAFVDYPNGDISRTAIGQVASAAADNKVFIVNRGLGIGTPATARGWKKIRIIRNAGGGYTLQHAEIGATAFSSIDIPKDDTHFFKYLSFENGIVSVAPPKRKWDIGWSYLGNVANFGTGEVPYMFQDIIFQNRNVVVAKVLSATKAYDAFTEANLADGTITAWNSSQLSIGADWRRTTPSPADVHQDRYYIIRDGDNNYYKLRFTALTNAGLRGYPAVAYQLLKRG